MPVISKATESLLQFASNFFRACKPKDYSKPGEDGQVLAKKTELENPIALLEQARYLETERGLEAAKPIYERAIASADGLDQTAIERSLEAPMSVAQDETVPQASRDIASAIAGEYLSLQFSRSIARVQYAIAINNAAIDMTPGADTELARALLAETAKLDPHLAGTDFFRLVTDRFEQGIKVDSFDIKQFAGK